MIVKANVAIDYVSNGARELIVLEQEDIEQLAFECGRQIRTFLMNAQTTGCDTGCVLCVTASSIPDGQETRMRMIMKRAIEEFLASCAERWNVAFAAAAKELNLPPPGVHGGFLNRERMSILPSVIRRTKELLYGDSGTKIGS